MSRRKIFGAWMVTFVGIEFVAVCAWGIGAFVGFLLGGMLCAAWLGFDETRGPAVPTAGDETP